MKDNKLHIGHMIALFFMLLGINQILMDISKFQVPFWQFLLSIIGIIAGIFLMKQWRKETIVFISIIAISVLVLNISNQYYELYPEGYAIEHLLYQQFHIKMIIAFFEWIFAYTFTPNASLETSFLWPGLTLYLLVAAFYLTTGMKSKWTRWMLFVPILIFILMYFFYYDLKWSIYNFYIAGLFIYYINVGYMKNRERVEAKRVAYRTTRLNIYGVGLIVVLLLLSNFTAAILPLETMNRIIDPYIPDIWNLRSDYERPTSKIFSFTSTSFQRFNDQLGGPIYEFSNLDLMRVRNYTDDRYLRGVVKNVYNGNRWTSNDSGYYLNSFTEVNSPDDIKTMTVKYLNMATGTLFAPLGPVSFNLDEEHVIYSTEGEVFFQSDLFTPRPSFYRISFTGTDYYYSENVDYVSVPAMVEEGVYQLTNTIVKPSMTDNEKMLAIIDYLREHYTYSLIPSNQNSQKDFVSQFLLEGESGYCTYFASSLAIMGRIAGVPTRYVEGFVIPLTPDKDNYYYIKDEHAHTWVEAYIPERGWVRYEATPVYEAINESVTSEDIDLQEILNAEIEQAREEGNSEKLAELEALKEADLQKKRDENMVVVKDNKTINWDWLWILLLLPLVIVVGYIVGKVREHLGNKRHQSIRIIYNMKDLCYEKNRQKGETIRVKISRVYPSLMYNRSIFDLIEKILYGNYVPDKEEFEALVKYHKDVRKLSIRRLGFLRYYQICYLPWRRKG